MKKILILFSFLSSLLILSACNEGNEQSANSNEVNAKEVGSEAQVNSSNLQIRNQEKFEEDAANNFMEKDERIAETLAEFELPEEGRISHEEAKEKFDHRPYLLDSNSIAFNNALVFNKETKLSENYIDVITAGTGINSSDHPYNEQGGLYETQVLGAFITSVKSLSEYRSTVSGELGESLEKLTEEEEELLNIEPGSEELRVSNEGEQPSVKGWRSIEMNIAQAQTYLGEVQEHSDEYEDIQEWTEETVKYFNEAEELGYENVEKAYEKTRVGMKRIDDMKEKIENNVL
ncbi:hypothetical protein [Salsuginibacillus kocurii]|uniref:hypothetical protein n=1 Tax=Salsuginibacillus kocurii TaxID=427078 RepID=UPI00035C8D83|nr:hypothetical protein [Salsuginibacillus kocurii]